MPNNSDLPRTRSQTALAAAEEQAASQHQTPEELACYKLRKSVAKLESFNRRKKVEVPLIALGILEVNANFMSVQDMEVPSDILGDLDKLTLDTVSKAFDKLKKHRAPYDTMEQLEAAQDAFVAELALVPGPMDTVHRPPRADGTPAAPLLPPLEPVHASVGTQPPNHPNAGLPQTTCPSFGGNQQGAAEASTVASFGQPAIQEPETSRLSLDVHPRLTQLPPSPSTAELGQNRVSQPFTQQASSVNNGNNPRPNTTFQVSAVVHDPPHPYDEIQNLGPDLSADTGFQQIGQATTRSNRPASLASSALGGRSGPEVGPGPETSGTSGRAGAPTSAAAVRASPYFDFLRSQARGTVQTTSTPTNSRTGASRGRGSGRGTARPATSPPNPPGSERTGPQKKTAKKSKPKGKQAGSQAPTGAGSAANPSASSQRQSTPLTGGRAASGVPTPQQAPAQNNQWAPWGWQAAGSFPAAQASGTYGAHPWGPPPPNPYNGATSGMNPVAVAGSAWAPQGGYGQNHLAWGSSGSFNPAAAINTAPVSPWNNAFTGPAPNAWTPAGVQGSATAATPNQGYNAYAGYPGLAPGVAPQAGPGSAPHQAGPPGPPPGFSQIPPGPPPGFHSQGSQQGLPGAGPPPGPGPYPFPGGAAGGQNFTGAPAGSTPFTGGFPQDGSGWGGTAPPQSSPFWQQQMQHDLNIMYQLQFPQPWRMPPPGDLPSHYRHMDPMRAIEKGLIKPFAGTVHDYPRFYNSFYNVVHIQPGALLYKVLALDKLITDERTTKLFSGLGTSPSDYLVRIERLEQHYGGPDRLQSYQLRSLRQLKGPIDKDLEALQDYTHALVSYLRNSPPHEASNLVLRDQLRESMSHGLRVEYNQYLGVQRLPDDNRSIALFLSQRLDSEIRAQETTRTGSSHRVRNAAHEHAAQEVEPADDNSNLDTGTEDQVHANAAAPRPQCLCCQQGTHRLAICEKFFLMVSTDRRRFAARQGLCFLCLESGHQSRGCPNRQRAKCGICGQNHHYLLHPSPNAAHVHQEEDLIDFQVSDSQYLSYGFQHAKDQPGTLQLDVALSYVTVRLRNPSTGKVLTVNLLADTGANTSCVDVGLATELDMTGHKEPYHVQVGGGRIHSYSAFLIHAEIEGLQPGAKAYKIALQAYKQPCGRLGRVDWAQAKQSWQHLADLDLPSAADRPVQGILGTQDFYLLAPITPAVVGNRHEPVAFMTRLGWMVGGQVVPKAQHAMHLHVVLMNHQEQECCPELRRALERMWQADHGPRKVHAEQAELPPALSQKEQRAVEVFDRTCRRQPDGRYEVGLLWRNQQRPPRNYGAALSAFYLLEKTMDRHPEMRTEFVKTITEWLNKDIAAYLSSNHADIRYIIPTFMVVRLDKQTTSYRLVVDGARRFNNACINDRLLPGPKLIQNIFDILVRFRQGRHAFTCDISAMYLNVRVPESDRPYLCLFFREHAGAPIRVVQLQSHPFGLSSSPYVAMRVVRDHLLAGKDKYPRAARAVQDNVLVDDFIVSHDEPTELARTRRELETALHEIGMRLHKMAANHSAILAGVPADRVAKTKVLGEDDIVGQPAGMPTIKTLGIIWNSEADTVAIQYQPKYVDQTLSLRKVVSDGGRLYDMLGLSLPVAMTSRIIQQLCWSHSSRWDDPIPEALADRWRQWSKNTTGISQVHIPRAVRNRSKPVTKQRLIIFVDASTEAQAAVAYIQTLYHDGQLDARLLAAKGKVSSLRKQESIPRLECAAAAMGAELGAKLAAILKWDMEDIVYFSDSTTTLWWIRATKPLKVFVANRVCMILDASQVRQWKHVATHENPADLPTRTCSVQGWARHNLWWWGPKFLTEPEARWPAQPPVTETAESQAETRSLQSVVRKLHLQHTKATYSPKEAYIRKIWSRFGCPKRGLRIAAIILASEDRWRTPRPWDWTTLEAKVLRLLVTGDQSHFLAECIDSVRTGSEVPSPFACWRPFLGSDGVLRINGRLKESRTVQATARCPILLTASMPCALELMRLKHLETRHVGGPNYLLAQMRQKYWVHQGLKVAKEAIKQCAHCQYRKARTAAQNTAPLHFTRENAPKGRVFHSIGIDMFGPLEVKMGRGKPRGKRYGIIFTCSFSRAINVEVMKDATADSCLMAFKRHVAVYGQPRFVNSDQGTNLQSVRKVMHEKITAWEDARPLVQHHFPSMHWHSNPPYSPSYGGHYESLIKVLKNAFKHLARWPRYLFDDEQLYTGLKEAAAMANMRPLTAPSTDPHDPPPLKPSDFLHSEVLGMVPDWRRTTLHTKVKTELEEFQEELWERMRKEVLPGLQKPRTWGKQNLIQTGDLVLYNHDDWRPDFWPLARVIESYPNQDGEARNVKIRYMNVTPERSEIKEAVHSTRNLYRLSFPPPPSEARLTPAHEEGLTDSSRCLAAPEGGEASIPVPESHPDQSLSETAEAGRLESL